MVTMTENFIFAKNNTQNDSIVNTILKVDKDSINLYLHILNYYGYYNAE